mgnify:CR=1 FL=1|tara:strand:- start:166 stop:1860 length:1695 start_codon:yes stop_codon:yes gene_type:complete
MKSLLYLKNDKNKKMIKKTLLLITTLLFFNVGFSQELSKEEKKQEKKEKKEENKKRKTEKKEAKDLIKREALEAKTFLYQNMTSFNLDSVEQYDYKKFTKEFGIPQGSSKLYWNGDELGQSVEGPKKGTISDLYKPLKKSDEYQNEIININKYDYFKLMHLSLTFRTEKKFYGLLYYKYNGFECEKLLDIYEFNKYLILEYQSQANDTSLSHKIILKSHFIEYNEMLNNNIIVLNILKKEEYTSIMYIDTVLKKIEIKNKLYPVINPDRSKFINMIYSQKNFTEDQEYFLTTTNKKWNFQNAFSDFTKITKTHASNIKLGVNKIDFEFDSLKVYKLNTLKFYEYIFDKEFAEKIDKLSGVNASYDTRVLLYHKIVALSYPDLKKMCDKNYWEKLIPKGEDFVLNFLDEVDYKILTTFYTNDTARIKENSISYRWIERNDRDIEEPQINPFAEVIRDMRVEDLWTRCVEQFDYLQKNETERKQKEKYQKDLLKKFGKKYVEEAQNGNIVVGMPEGLLQIPLRVWTIKSNTEWSNGYRIYCTYKFDTSRRLIVYVSKGKVSSISTW